MFMDNNMSQMKLMILKLPLCPDGDGGRIAVTENL